MKTWKIRFVKTMTTLLMLALTSNVHAAGWSGQAKITSIFSLGEDSVLIKLSGYTNPTSCQVDSAGDVWIDPTVNETWFAMLLAAHLAGKEVDLFIAGTCKTLHFAGVSYGQVAHVRLIGS